MHYLGYSVPYLAYRHPYEMAFGGTSAAEGGEEQVKISLPSLWCISAPVIYETMAV